MEKTINEILLEKRWEFYNFKSKLLMKYGINNNLINIYDEELIECLRGVYYSGVPASVILLSELMTNGYCYRSAFLMASALLNSGDDIKILFLTVDGIKLNPKEIDKIDPLYAEHFVVERTLSSGKKVIYDTTQELVFDKNLYFLKENPKVIRVINKEQIVKFIRSDKNYSYELPEYYEEMAEPVLYFLYDNVFEESIYARKELRLLQREISLFRMKIKSDESRIKNKY